MTGFKILRGVKQGDALSCILFILAVEPLLRNINKDTSINGIKIRDIQIPKALAYADDVACIVHPDRNNLQKIFNHYQAMSDLSGLNLNADKTELITNSHALAQYSLTYNQNTFLLAPCKDIKLNGIYVSYDSDVVRVKNFEKIYLSVEKQLKMWSSRNLSLLGKIQIFKTFGLSQILFASSTIMFTKHEDKQLTNLIYKFIWTRNMDGNKAPDRIKRSILNQNIKSLGFGMIDFKEVITSIRVKNVLRLLNNPDQPLNNIISSNINSSIIKIKCLNSIRPTIDSAIMKIREICIKKSNTPNLEAQLSNANIDKNKKDSNHILWNKNQSGLKSKAFQEKLSSTMITSSILLSLSNFTRPLYKFIYKI